MPDPTPLRIVHLLRAPMGGLFRHVRDLANEHESQGHRVGVICDVAGTAGYNEPMVDRLSDRLSLGLHRVAMRRNVGPADLAAGLRIWRIIKELQPDVLHGHGAKGGVFARTIGSLARAGRSRVARLYSPHGGSLHFDPGSRSGKVYFRTERLLERMTDHIIFVAEFERRAYEAKIGAPLCRWSVNYNGLGAEELDPVRPDADAADFLFLGELRTLKGPDLFLQALATVRRRHPDAGAVMVGDGPDRQAVTELIRDLDMADAVSISDPMPARSAFAKARIFVMPSRAEAMPYVVLEALGAGMPVIASRVGGIPEILGEDNPALVTPDISELADAMDKALTDPGCLRDAMTSTAVLRDRFSVATMAANALSAYRDALT